MKEKKIVPFFERFLENQDNVNMSETKGGRRDMTAKWPSDSDEN